MKCTVYGLFDRGNLLDMIRNFIIFETEYGPHGEKGGPLPAIPGGQQDGDRGLALTQPSDQRRGIVWAYPGLGQESDYDLCRPKALESSGLEATHHHIVVDRLQLLDQMMGELFKTNTENTVIAETFATSGGWWERVTGIGALFSPPLTGLKGCPRSFPCGATSFMLVDEAHRTH